MNARVDLTVSPDVDAAIMRVLAAEQKVREDVERCRREAEQRIDSAHRQARDIAERAARRAARVHHWTDRAIATRLDQLESERAALLRARADGDDATALTEAVNALADELLRSGA